jgi:aspartyl-tRNA(Asn)/glutamyl-tRNA(Gln) amidotransferase subunit A
MKLHELTITEAHRLLKNREISSTELTQAVLDRIGKVEQSVGAYLTVEADAAMQQAAAADQAIAAGNISPLTGIPLSIKDLICTQGVRTTCASKILEHFVPPYDATVIEKLKQQTPVLVGKVNMDEFAMGSSTENSGMKTTRNPWNPDCIPGGSSGGSAASVAADMCLGSLGSDTGGSIRQPASHCGVVGMKPTYGRVSRFGLVAFASSLDQIGPLAKNVADSAILLSGIAGYDPKDSTSVDREVPDFAADLQAGAGNDLKGMKIGVPREYHNVRGMDPDVKTRVADAIETLQALGADCIDVSLPHAEYAVAAYYVIAPSEASANLSRYDGVKYGFRDKDAGNLAEMYQNTRSRGFGPEVQRRIIIGTYALSSGYYDAYYAKASKVRTLIMDDFQKVFATCDAIVSPVAPTPAFPIGDKVDDPLTMYLSDIFTLSANLAGIPGISVPCGFSSSGLPVGLQLLGRHFDESTLFRVAHHFEQTTDVHLRKPSL